MAGNTIGALEVSFTANTAAFVAGTQKARTELASFGAQSNVIFGRFDKTVTSAARSVSNFAKESLSLRNIMGGLGISLGTAAIVGFAKSSFTMAAGLGDLAKQAGVSIEEFQTLRFVLQQNGVAFDEAQTLIQRLTNSIGQAKEKAGPARDALADLMLGPKDVSGNAAQSIEVITAALLRETDVTKRATIERALFGRAGQDIEAALPALAQNLDAMTESLKKNGQILNKDVAEAAHKASNEISAAFGKLEIAAAPAVTFVVGGLADMVKNLETFADKLKGTDWAALWQGVKNIPQFYNPLANHGYPAETTSPLAASMPMVPRLLANSPLASNINKPKIAAVPSGERFTTVEEDNAAKELQRLRDQYEKMNRAEQSSFIAQFDAKFKAMQKATGDFAESMKVAVARSSAELVKEQNTTAEFLARGTRQYWDAMRTSSQARLQEEIKVIQTEKEQEIQRLDEIGTQGVRYQEARAAIEETTDNRIKAARERTRTELKQIDEDQTQALANRIAMADSLRNGLMDIGTAALHGFGSMKDAAKRALEQIITLIWQLKVMKPLIEGLGGKWGDVWGGGSGGGGGGILNAIGSAITGGGDIGAFGHGYYGGGAGGASFAGFYAAGGTIPAGSWGVAGENGPEPIYAGSVPMTVMPNSGSGDVYIHQQIVVMPDVASQSRKQVIAMMPEIGARSVEAVQQAHRRRIVRF